MKTIERMPEDIDRIVNKLKQEMEKEVMPLLHKISAECEQVNPVKELRGQFRPEIWTEPRGVAGGVVVRHPRAKALFGIQYGREPMGRKVYPVRARALKFKWKGRIWYRAWVRMSALKPLYRFSRIIIKYADELKIKCMRALRRSLIV